jgi:hypothetical protein
MRDEEVGRPGQVGRPETGNLTGFKTVPFADADTADSLYARIKCKNDRSGFKRDRSLSARE